MALFPPLAPPTTLALRILHNCTRSVGKLQEQTTQNQSDIKLYTIMSPIMIATFLISLDTIPAITSAFHTTGDMGCSSIMFIVGRAIAAICGSVIITIVLPIQHRLLFTRLIVSVFSIGRVIALIIGGAFTSHATRQWCFLLDLPTGAITIMNSLGLPGCAIFLLSIVMVFLAPQWGGNEHAWSSATIIRLSLGELHRAWSAMIPFKLLKDQSIALSIYLVILVMGGYIMPVYYLPEWFQIVHGASSIRSSVVLLPFIGFQILQDLGTSFAGKMGLLTVQNELKYRPAIIPIWIATVPFAQHFGTSVLRTIAETIFHNSLVDGLEERLR
ncbi:hypothetical protein BJX63DRAFT_425005 [Aspergillus granulosus]|uniref:Uncharacterized protein n=1 Tax=Aspergillus granulosus TaxID=176169 RepID=A0ABR4GXM1_9EURO